MTYYDAVNQAIDLTVVTDEETGVSYLEPRYRSVLFDNDIGLPGHVLPGDYKDEELWEILKLEVEKRNAKHNVSHALSEWAYTILTQTVDPALVSEENDLMKNIMEYLQLNQEVKEKKEELDQEEINANCESKAKQSSPIGISFTKKEILTSN